MVQVGGLNGVDPGTQHKDKALEEAPVARQNTKFVSTLEEVSSQCA